MCPFKEVHMPFDKILLTSDLSDESLRAFAPLSEFAASQDAKITMLHVVEEIPVVPHGAPLAPIQYASGGVGVAGDPDTWLADHRKVFPDGMVTETRVVQSFNVAKTIAEVAVKDGFDLIALSTHGRTGFRHMILGSVAEKVLQHAKCPVLVYPRTE
jgi:nucleotide-binding universal stress UspA family protein